MQCRSSNEKSGEKRNGVRLSGKRDRADKWRYIPLKSTSLLFSSHKRNACAMCQLPNNLFFFLKNELRIIIIKELTIISDRHEKVTKIFKFAVLQKKDIKFCTYNKKGNKLNCVLSC